MFEIRILTVFLKKYSCEKRSFSSNYAAGFNIAFLESFINLLQKQKRKNLCWEQVGNFLPNIGFACDNFTWPHNLILWTLFLATCAKLCL